MISNSVCLVGLPGSGKSTVGRQLAKAKHWPFSDSDLEIEREVGCSIAAYFAHAGEDCFRDYEEAILERLTERAGVLSTGGGAVLRCANHARLRRQGIVVYLHASPEDIFKRLRHDTKRPLLQVNDPLQRLREMYAERDSLYREVSHFVVDTGRTPVAAMVNRILVELDRVSTLADTKV